MADRDEDAQFLRNMACGLTYCDTNAQAAAKHRLAEIGMRIGAGFYEREIATDRDRLDALVNSPETRDFLLGVRNEVAHQVERWGTVHDRAKEPEDWFWLLGYLASKALAAHRDGKTDKALHHCISTAAVLANWHTHIARGAGLMQPGSSDLQEFLRDTFGANFLEATEARHA